jgi:hypothetical protein
MRLWLPLLAVVAMRATAQGAVENVPFWRLDVPGFNALEQPEELVIRDQLELERFWRRLWATVDQPPKTPYVDFKKEAVVVIVMGQRPTGGYSIRANHIQRTGGRLRVIYSTSSPGRGCITTQSFETPVAILRFQLPAPEPDFIAQHHTRNCE